MSQKLSVIIPTKNRKEDLFETLDSVLKQSVLPFEVIIVDQSQERINFNSMKNLADDKDIKFKVIYDPRMKGLTQARNEGLDNMQGDIVLFLDDDVILDQNYIKSILETYSEPCYKDVAGVGGMVEVLQEKRKLKFNRFFKLGPFADTRERIKNKPPGIYESPYLHGGSMSLKIEKIGDLRFDENMIGYCHGEDMDFCYRLSQKHKLVLNRNAKLLHMKSVSGRVSAQRICNEVYFCYYFFVKNLPFKLKNLLCYVWVNVGMALRPLFKLNLKMYKSVFRGYKKVARSMITGKPQW